MRRHNNEHIRRQAEEEADRQPAELAEYEAAGAVK